MVDAVITNESPSLEEHLHGCLLIALHRLKFPAPHPGALGESGDPTILTLRKTYGDKIRFVFKQNPLPFHAQAALAAEASLAANGQGKFEEYRKLLYYGGGDSLAREQLVSYATQLGLDVARFNTDLDNHTYAAQVAADKADARRFNVNGVPTFYVNGKPIQGAQPVDKFMELIDAELAAH